MKKLKILGVLSEAENNAIGFYRLWQPLKVMERLGLAEIRITPKFDWGKPIKGDRFTETEWFVDVINNFKPDIIVACRHDHPVYISRLMAIREHAKCPLVVDTDDDVHAVRPFNPGYASYSPDSYTPAFNIKLMSIADAITTSTEQLRELHLRYGHPVYMVPNSIDFKDRVFPKRNPHKKIRIGWFGSACHYESLQIIKQAVVNIIQKYPEVEFVYTNLFHDIWANPPKEYEDRLIPVCKILGCKERHNSCNKAYQTFDKYAKLINRVNLDIGLAPLQDYQFNRSKSNLRILEYWADKVAVIASPVRPYTETIVDGQNGLLAKEKGDWFNAMERLILDEKLRNKLKENGSKSLKKWDIEKTAKSLYKIYNQIINA